MYKRHVAEQRVAKGIENLIGLGAAVNPAYKYEQGQQRLDHTGTSQSRNDRLEDSRQAAEKACHNSFLLFRSLCLLPEMSHFLDLIAYVAHICSDYDLKLSVFGDYSLNALYLFQALYISLSGIVQNKSQTCHTVCHAGYILFAADQFQNVGRCLFVIHLEPLLKVIILIYVKLLCLLLQ